MQYHNLQGIGPVYRTVIRIRKKDAKKELKAVLKLKPSSRGRISAGRPRCPPRTDAGSPGHLQQSSDLRLLAAVFFGLATQQNQESAQDLLSSVIDFEMSSGSILSEEDFQCTK